MRISRTLIVLGLVLAAAFAAYFMRGAELPAPALQLGPIRHAVLPAALELRIRRFEAVFAEVYPRSHEEWLEGFRRDQHPESEVAIWEDIAFSYTKFLAKHELNAAARGEAFELLIVRSTSDAQTTLSHIKLKHLGEAQALELVQSFWTAPKPIQVSN
jgi:hypothetical protein